MNFSITNEILGLLNLKNATVTCECDERKKSDYVIIDAENNVGFEVFDGEITVFYFTDHRHFEDYSSENQEDGYQNRAKDFLINLFENKIKHIKSYKGKKLAEEKYYMIYSDNREEYIGGTWWGLVRLINPFAKKQNKTTVYKFNGDNGCFETFN